MLAMFLQMGEEKGLWQWTYTIQLLQLRILKALKQYLTDKIQAAETKLEPNSRF